MQLSGDKRRPFMTGERSVMTHQARVASAAESDSGAAQNDSVEPPGGKVACPR